MASKNVGKLPSVFYTHGKDQRWTVLQPRQSALHNGLSEHLLHQSSGERIFCIVGFPIVQRGWQGRQLQRYGHGLPGQWG
jgi:hypothetical protein